MHVEGDIKRTPVSTNLQPPWQYLHISYCSLDYLLLKNKVNAELWSISNVNQFCPVAS